MFKTVDQTKLAFDRTQATILFFLYSFAVCLPAIDVDFTQWIPAANDEFTVYKELPGYFCLHPLFFMCIWWWANPLFLLGLVFLAKGKRLEAFACGVSATLIALSVCRLIILYHRALAADYGKTIGLRFPLRPGYFVWLTCMFGLTACAFPPSFKKHVDPQN